MRAARSPRCHPGRGRARPGADTRCASLRAGRNRPAIIAVAPQRNAGREGSVFHGRAVVDPRRGHRLDGIRRTRPAASGPSRLSVPTPTPLDRTGRTCCRRAARSRRRERPPSRRVPPLCLNDAHTCSAGSSGHRRRAAARRTLALLSDGSSDAGMVQALHAAGCRVSHATCASRWAISQPTEYTVRPQERDDYRALLDALPEPPAHIVWLWSHGAATDWQAEDYCYALHALLQALDGWLRRPGSRSWQTALQPFDEERMLLVPERGACRALSRPRPRSFRPCPSLWWSSREVSLNRPTPPACLPCAATRRRNVRCRSRPTVLATDVQKTELPATPAVKLRRNGVYMITGGLVASAFRWPKSLRATCIRHRSSYWAAPNCRPRRNGDRFADDPGCER